jgi:hypothetical protein
MALVDLIRESIETALTEAEALGREKFLAKYKCGPAIEWLKQQFPLRKDLQQPFELYRAAREKLKGKPQTG